jgi:hypothetical protein
MAALETEASFRRKLGSTLGTRACQVGSACQAELSLRRVFMLAAGTPHDNRLRIWS